MRYRFEPAIFASAPCYQVTTCVCCDRERGKMSKSAGKKPKEKSDKTKADNFVWTDDEVQLLLEVTNDYKVSKAAENIDWD